MLEGKDALLLETLAGTPSQTTGVPGNSAAESPDPIRGQGGGLADMVPAEIDGEQPAALSEGEFVWPADIVSYMGDGSSEAGARVLNGVVQEIRSLMSQQGKDGGSPKQVAEALK